MGIAAYNRGSQVIANQAAAAYPVRNTAFELMDRMNALPKKSKGLIDDLVEDNLKNKCHLPKGKALIQKSRGVWWLMDPDTPFESFSYYYPSLSDLITSWDIALTGFNETTGIWEAVNI